MMNNKNYNIKLYNNFFDNLLNYFREVEFIYFPEFLTIPEIYERALYEGLLPMTIYFEEENNKANNKEMYENKIKLVTVFKLHFERSLIFLKDFNHIGKTVRNKANKYYITVDKAYDEVCDGINKKYGEINWLVPDLVKVLKHFFNNDNSLVTIHTIEVWNKNGELVAGDFGAAIGKRFLSLSGFYRENNSGTVLLYTLGTLLKISGFEIWDLGMYIEYKEKLGAKLYDRKKYLTLFKNIRDYKIKLIIPENILSKNSSIQNNSNENILKSSGYSTLNYNDRLLNSNLINSNVFNHFDYASCKDIINLVLSKK